MLRDLLRSLGRSDRRNDKLDSAGDDLWASVGQSLGPGSELLARIEQAALDVYAAHGLPTRAGHYRRDRRGQSWTFLGETLTPEARWALLLERPPEAGWRYGTLPDLGRTGVPDVVAAAAVLDSCARLRKGPPAAGVTGPWAEIDLAIQLGAQWHALEGRRSRGTELRLSFTAPDTGLRADGTPKSPRRKPPPKA